MRTIIRPNNISMLGAKNLGNFKQFWSFLEVSLVGFILICCSFTLIGCEPSTEQAKGIQNAIDAFLQKKSSSELDESEDHESEDSNENLNVPSCRTERFVQPAAEITHKLDILFVTDTSSSLNEERGRIADGIDAFVQALPETVDYQIAVMLAHGSNSNHCGALYKYRNSDYVLSSSELSLNDLRNKLKMNLLNPPSDMHSDGGEIMTYSFMRGLDHGKVESSKAKGFFRDDAALAVIFVTDENDICAHYPAGVARVYDSSGTELEAFRRDCGGVTTDSLLAKLKDFQAGKPYLVGGIYYNNLRTVPRGGENEFGYGIDDIVKAAHGVSVDLANGNYTEGLSSIGRLATIKLNLLTDFKLSGEDIDWNSVRVKVDENDANFSVNSSLGEVNVFEPGGALSSIDIFYCKNEPLNSPGGSSSSDPTGGTSSSDPAGTSGSTGTNDPTGSSTETTDPSGGSNTTDPTGNSGATDPTGGTGAGDPTGGTPPDPVGPTGQPGINSDFSTFGFDAATSSDTVFLLWYTPGFASTSQVYWGLSPSLGNASLPDPDLTEEHALNISGLASGTVYYFQSVSVTQDGLVSYSPIIQKQTK